MLDIRTTLPDLDPAEILSSGAADLSGHVPSQYLDDVVRAYSNGLVQTFIVAMAMAALSIVGACFVEWRNVKSAQQGTDALVPAKVAQNVPMTTVESKI